MGVFWAPLPLRGTSEISAKFLPMPTFYLPHLASVPAGYKGCRYDASGTGINLGQLLQGAAEQSHILDIEADFVLQHRQRLLLERRLLGAAGGVEGLRQVEWPPVLLQPLAASLQLSVSAPAGGLVIATHAGCPLGNQLRRRGDGVLVSHREELRR